MKSQWTFRYFLFLFGAGEGKGEPKAPERGGTVFFTENLRGGGSPWAGAGRMFARNGGGGANFFFFGAEIPTKKINFRARQRSGEGVVRGNGRPKGCFWRVRLFSAPLRFALKASENLKAIEKKQTLQNTFLDNRFSARRLLRSFSALP